MPASSCAEYEDGLFRIEHCPSCRVESQRTLTRCGRHLRRFSVTFPLSTSHLRSIAWRFKNHRHPPVPASRTHQTPFQPPQWEVWPSRSNQRLKVKLLTVDALPHGPCFLAITIGAAHMHLPTKAPRHA